MWHIPRFTGRYVEPFLGGGALFFYLEPRQAIINDINKPLIKFYLGVRNNYDKLRKELNEIEDLYEYNRRLYEAEKCQHPNDRIEDKNEELYYRLRAMFNGTEKKCYSEALLYFFINKTAYSGMIRYNANGEFNVPYGRYQHLNTQVVTLHHKNLLKRAEVYCKDYSKIFDMCNDDDFIFLDPPYDCTFSDYGNEEYKDGFNEDNHRRLAEDFKNLSCKTLMVIGKTPLIEELYGDFVVDEYAKSYAVNIKNRFKAEATHLVIANYKKSYDDIKIYEAKVGQYQLPLEVACPRLFEKMEEYGKDKQ